MEQRLIKLIQEFFKISEEEARSASMETVKNWDSLTHVELIMSLEEELEVPRINPDEIVRMISIENIKEVLKEKGMSI